VLCAEAAAANKKMRSGRMLDSWAIQRPALH
jgi:hypothetical protein